jgi:DNA replication protein DnaC
MPIKAIALPNLPGLVQSIFSPPSRAVGFRALPGGVLRRDAGLKMLCKMLSSTFIDELGYLNLKPEQSNIFFKLMEERYRQHSTIITTNLVYDEWPNFLGSRPMVEALLSRLRHYCHTVDIDGPSLRELQG